MKHLDLVSDLNRFESVAHVLIDEGFASILSDISVLPKLSLSEKFELRHESKKPVSQRLKIVMQKAGPIWFALGVFLSRRPDLISQHLAKELGQVQFSDEIDDDVALAKKKIQKAISVKEINSQPYSITPLFYYFHGISSQKKPITIKVVRPKVFTSTPAELSILHALVHAASEKQQFQKYNFQKILSEFRLWLLGEFDLRQVSKSLEHLQKTNILLPKVFPSSDHHVLAYERISGVRVTHAKELLKKRTLHSQTIASQLYKHQCDLFFEYGLIFPNPSSYTVFGKQKIAIHDFDDVIHVCEEKRLHIAQLILGIMTQKEHKIVQSLLLLSNKSYFEQIDIFGWELKVKQELRNSSLGVMLEKILQMSMELGYKPCIELLTFARGVKEFDEVVFALSPTSKYLLHARPHIEKIAKSLILHQMSHQEQVSTMQEQTQPQNPWTDLVERASRRISYSLLLAAFVLSGSILLASADELVLFVAVPFFIVSVVLALFLLKTAHH